MRPVCRETFGRSLVRGRETLAQRVVLAGDFLIVDTASEKTPMQWHSRLSGGRALLLDLV